jgi:hypothetical protein
MVYPAADSKCGGYLVNLQDAYVGWFTLPPTRKAVSVRRSALQWPRKGGGWVEPNPSGKGRKVARVPVSFTRGI